MSTTSISELHHIKYSKQFLPGIAGTEVRTQGLKYPNDQPRKNSSQAASNYERFACPLRYCVLSVLWLFTRNSLRGYNCPSCYSTAWRCLG